MSLKLQISSNTYSTKPYYTAYEKQTSIEYSSHKDSIICLVSQKIFFVEYKIPEGQFRNILVFYFQKGKNADWIIEKYVAFSYGDECLNDHWCQKWFKRFCFEKWIYALLPVSG